MTGQIITSTGLKTILNRAFKSSPDYTAPSLLEVGTGTTNPTISDTSLETPVELTSGVYFQAMSTGYPILDETNLQVTFRAFLNTLQANGNTITEFGIFNSDSTKLLFSRAVVTAIEKDNLTEISYVEKDHF